MDSITRIYSQFTKTHFIGFGVTLLVATAICVGVVVSYHHVGTSSSLSPSFRYFKEKLAQIDHATKWQRGTVDNVSLTDAFVGGTDRQDPIYVCRVLQTLSYWGYSNLIPGTYTRKTGKCRYTYDGKAFDRDEFEILTTKDASALIWLRSSNAELYSGAITAGRTHDNDDLQIARIDLTRRKQSIGKIHDLYRKAYVPDGDDEHEYSTHDILYLRDFAL